MGRVSRIYYGSVFGRVDGVQDLLQFTPMPDFITLLLYLGMNCNGSLCNFMSTPQFLLHFSKIKGKIEMEIFSAQNSSIFNRRSNRKGAGMGLFNRKKKEKELEAEKAEAKAGKEEAKDGKTKARESKTEDAQAESKETGMKQYIKGAGGTIVSKSILEGRSKLKWLFRQEDGHGNGWIAFGDTDTQEYVDNPENMAVVDFNVLANIEPAVVNVFYLPYGADLEFRKDETGAYFVDTGTGEEIREQVKPPLQEIFEKNLKFLNKETYPEEFFQSLFQRGGMIEAVCIGEADFPTGEIVLSDPIVYLGSKYMVTLEKKIPKGSYPVELSICHSQKAGLRIAAARLVLRDSQTVRHEIAMPREAIRRIGTNQAFGRFLAWTPGWHVFQMCWQQKNTVILSAAGKRRIPVKMSIMITLHPFSARAMRCTRRFNGKAAISSSGRCRGQAIGCRCLQAGWGTAFTAATGGLAQTASLRSL